MVLNGMARIRSLELSFLFTVVLYSVHGYLYCSRLYPNLSPRISLSSNLFSKINIMQSTMKYHIPNSSMRLMSHVVDASANMTIINAHKLENEDDFENLGKKSSTMAFSSSKEKLNRSNNKFNKMVSHSVAKSVRFMVGVWLFSKQVSSLAVRSTLSLFTNEKTITVKSKQSMKKPKFPRNWFKVIFNPTNFFRICLTVAIALVVEAYVSYRNSLTQVVSYSQFLKALSDSPEKILSVRVSPAMIYFLYEGRRCLTHIVNINEGVLGRLVKSGVDFAAIPPSTNIFNYVWSAAYLYFIWMMFSRLQGPKDENIGKSRDQMALESYGKLSFDDVAGQDKAKLEVKEVCDMLRSPEQYTSLGARLPCGILLCGPPGTGKTLLARVTAAEAQVPFFACSATDFVEIFVGRGPARIRKLFKSAQENSPCIIFIDEIDSIGRSRRLNTMNSEQENTLNQLLTCMDGLDTSNNGVIVIAATNRAELLDPALLRPGRFDRLVQCSLPDKDGRLAVLKVHVRRLVLDSSVKLDVIATMTNGLSGADLATLVNEAAIRAVRRGGQSVSQQDLFEALKSFYNSRGLQLGGSSIGGVAADLWKMIGLGSNDETNGGGKPALSGV